jgi:hypothetical protein
MVVMPLTNLDVPLKLEILLSQKPRRRSVLNQFSKNYITI